jgi:hypothetical protein
VIVRCHQTPAGSLRWKVRLDQGLRPDITIAARMTSDNAALRYIADRKAIGKVVIDVS